MALADPTRFKRFSKRILEAKKDFIEKGYPKRGLRFLYGPRESLNDPNGNVVLAINPGDEDDMSDRLYVAQNAYLSETWGRSDFQVRVKVLMRAIFQEADISDWESSFNRTLTSNLFPFRSPSLSHLDEEEEADYRSFGEAFWQDVFSEIAPRCVIALGGPTRDAFLAIAETLTWKLEHLVSYKNAKGNSIGSIYRFEHASGEGRALLAQHYANKNGVRDPGDIKDIAERLRAYVSI